MPANSSVLGVEYKINLLDAAKGKRFVARGRVIRPGARFVVECDVEAVNDGKTRLDRAHARDDDVHGGQDRARKRSRAMSGGRALKPRDPDWERKVHDSFARQTLMRTIGARIAALAPGRCEIELPYRRDLCQQHGYLHARHRHYNRRQRGRLRGLFADAGRGRRC